MNTPTYRGRFAPSPTGPLHAGSLLTAFGSWLLARHHGGEWLIRIEDVDPPRTVAGASDHQLAQLDACGLRSDGPVVRQSQRGDRYAQVLSRLLQAGQAFSCHCSRSDLAANGGIHHHCVTGAERATPAVRLRVPKQCVLTFQDGLRGRFTQDLHADVGDVVLRRADGCWAYQHAVVVDDLDQGMTDIVRGADLLESTPRQILLLQTLGATSPRYLHLPLLLGPDGHKLSKSHDAPPIDLEAPLPALRRSWYWLGQAPSALEAAGNVGELLERAIAAFDPLRLPAGDITVTTGHS